MAWSCVTTAENNDPLNPSRFCPALAEVQYLSQALMLYAENKDMGLVQCGACSFTSQRKSKGKGNCLLNVK